MAAGEDAPLTAGDWIGFALAAVAVGGLFLFPLIAGSFEAMFRDFGAVEQLPGLTRLALKPWLSPSLAALPAAGLGVVLGSRLSRGARRLLIVSAFLVSSLLLVACAIALYLPLLELSSAISA